MRKITRLLGLFLLTALMIQCREDEEITPISTDPNDSGNPMVTDTLSVAGDSAQAEKFSFIGEKKNETDEGFAVEGALYVETDSGKVAVMEDAEFTVSQNPEGNMQSMEGTGPAQLPDLGVFKDFSLDDATEAAFVYNTGKYFKDNNEDFKKLPLRDTSYYFFFNFLNLAAGDKEDLTVKNAKLGITSYFVNIPQQEIIIPTGSFEIDLPGESSYSVGEDIAIGISGKKSFHFTPQQFQDSTLNAIITERKPFADMTGFLFLSGEISLGDKIPMKIGGNSVLDGDMDVIFSDGFGAASFSYAANGKVIFGHDLLELLPKDFNVELANSTYKLEHSYVGAKQSFDLKFAGEFDDNAWMETVLDNIAGTNISQYVPFTGNEGTMYASFGSDWEFLVDTYFAINTPHLGKQPTRRGTLHITEEQLKIRGALAIPFVPGELTATGKFGYDGTIHLEAKGESGIEFEGVKMDGNIDFDIYNDKATLVGNLDIPYGLATVDIDGVIDSEGLTFTGYAGNRDLVFKDNFSLPVAGVDIYANFRQTNPEFSLSGQLKLQHLEQPLVDISGTISSRGVEFHGNINNHLKLQQGSAPMSIPLIDVSLTAKTWEGVYFNGGTSLPFGLASATVNGYIIGSRRDNLNLPEIFLDVYFSSDPKINIKGLNLPTSKFDMTLSTVKGIHFNGKLNYGLNLGYMKTEGNISGNQISFVAEESKEIKFGELYFDSDLKISAGTHLNGKIAELSGTIYTTIGNFQVNGQIALDGSLSFSGSINAGCIDPFVIPQYDRIVVSKVISFAKIGPFPSAFFVSASVRGCDGNCGELKDCESITGISTNIDLDTGKFQVCIPVPLAPDPCFSF